MSIAALVLPVFGIIATGWLAGVLGYLPRSLAGPLVQFAYSVAMPALVFLTIARLPISALLDWSFLAAFGGSSLIAFVATGILARAFWEKSAAEAVIIGSLTSMTNTGFVALPILQALYGDRGVIFASIATAFTGIVMFPCVIILLEFSAETQTGTSRKTMMIKQVMLNPLVFSTVAGLLWSVSGASLPKPVTVYINTFGETLMPCALFSIGLGLSLGKRYHDLKASLLIATTKLLITPCIALALCTAMGLDSFLSIATVVCAAVPTAKTAYVLAGVYQVQDELAGSIVSMTTLVSIPTLLGWLYFLE
ncbi:MULTISPECIES: AEC family transporter [Rhodomicrobium]|uniref:AEC family transporter n=1 Tax=Rhodomicrobium TaxID=1068 RepID=UPI000B4B0E94|nr:MULTISPECIES: AEC family transporter [Rhodomicrobium]